MQGIKINQVILNVGLENNFYTSKQNLVEIIKTVGQLTTFETSVDFQGGEYMDNPERTAVVYCSTTMTAKEVKEAVKKLCIVFTQEFIPFEFKSTTETVAELVNNPNMKDLPEITFSYDYFLK